MGFNKSSRTLNAGKNAFSAIANKLFILVLTFVSRRFFISYIGIEYLGINGLFANILTLLSMADLGLGTALNVSLYKPIAENDTRRITALVNYFKVIYRMIFVGVLIIGLSLLPFLKYLINMEEDIPYIELYYVVFVLKSAVSYLLVYKSSVLYADQKNFVINNIDAIVNSVKVVVQIAVIILFKNYLLYILLDVASVLLKNIILSLKADKEYSFIKNDDKLDKEERKTIFSDVSSVFLYKIAWSLLNGTDNILMSIIVGTITVGLYSNYYTITSAVELFIGLLFTSLTASIGNLVATESNERRYSVFKVMQMVSFWICGFTVVALAFLMQDFVTIWLGKDYVMDNLMLIAIVINVFFSTCMRPVWTFREGTGMYRQIRYIMFVTAVLNLVLSIILGKLLGASGILFATSIAKVTTYFWYEPNILFRDFFKKKVLGYYLDYAKNISVVAVALVICGAIFHFISRVSILTLLLKCVVIFVVVNIIFYLFYRKTDSFKVLLGRLKRVK